MAAASLRCSALRTRCGDMPRLRPVGSLLSAHFLVLTFMCLQVSVRSLRPSEELQGSETIIGVLHGGAFVRGHNVAASTAQALKSGPAEVVGEDQDTPEAATAPAGEAAEPAAPVEKTAEPAAVAEKTPEPAAPVEKTAEPAAAAKAAEGAPPAGGAAAPAGGAASFEDQKKIYEAKEKLKEAFEKVKEEDKKRTGDESYIAKAIKLLTDTVAKNPPAA